MNVCTGCGCDRIPIAGHANLCMGCLLRLGIERISASSEGTASAVERLGPIGRGPNGIVYLGRLPGDSGRFVTLKVIERPLDVGTFVGLMRSIIARLDHAADARIARVLDAAAMSDGGAVVCAEYASGCQIDHFFRARGSARERLEVLAAVCHQVADLHEAGIVHGSLKVQNVIVAASASGPIATLLDTGIRMAIDASCLRRGGAAHAGERDQLFNRSGRDRDVIDLHRLVLDASDGAASATVCGRLLRRLQRSRCLSASELGTALQAAALHA